MSTSSELAQMVLNQDGKIEVLADEYGVPENLIRRAVAANPEIASQVNNAPRTDLARLEAEIVVYGFGDYESHQRYRD